MKPSLTQTTYAKLRAAIAREIQLGAERVKGTYQQEVLRTHWKIGRVLAGGEAPAYLIRPGDYTERGNLSEPGGLNPSRHRFFHKYFR
ncbi:MAG: hypothetical protein V1923_06335 [Candidatus Omnitrophota bacterium]